jgi:hypothetical protein
MRMRRRVVLALAGALAVCCGLFGTAAARGPSAPGPKAPFVGRWETTKTCSGVVQALKRTRLLRLAPGVVGDFFPGETPQQLARKRHLCRGAALQRHSHVFTRDGLFGSVNQTGEQVDDGRYQVIDARTFHIGNPDTAASFHYRVENTAGGKALALRSVITRRMRRKALAHPLQFSPAGWAVAVAYTGHTWEQVPCKRWC